MKQILSAAIAVGRVRALTGAVDEHILSPMRRASLIVAVTGGLVIGVGGASGHAAGTILYGAGTATIDGTLSPSEWAGARRIEFGANRPAFDGGGTIPAALTAMNNGANLYVALQVGRPTYGGNTSLAMYFDNDHDGVIEPGDDAFLADVGAFSTPRFIDWHWGPCIPGGAGAACPVLDLERGGASDGDSAAGIAGGAAVIEARHPLNSADDAHDFSLGAGSVAGFGASIRLFSASTPCNEGGQCYADTLVPIGLPSHAFASGYGNLVVSPDTIPPDTSITGGPADGSSTNDRQAAFGLSGNDNLTPPGELAFACSLDGGAFAACGASAVFSGLTDGEHRLEARATDELGHTDQSPAVRRWTVDTALPETSIVAGPRANAVTNRRHVTFVLAGSDNATPAGGLLFDCSLDGGPIAACDSRPAFDGLADGRHIFEGRARDAAGNIDATPATRQWVVDATPPSRPRVRVRVTGLKMRATLSATDRGSARLRFRCSLDGGPYRPCARRFSRRVRPGRHRLRARAFDRAGNASKPGLARFRASAR